MNSWRILRIIMLLFAGVTASSNVNAQSTEKALILPAASKKATEIQLAKLVEDALNVKSSLRVNEGDEDDLKLYVSFAEDVERGIPKTTIIIDAIPSKVDESNEALGQVIHIVSTIDYQIPEGKESKLLEFVNLWNSRPYPIRTFAADRRIFTGRALSNGRAAPITEQLFLANFLDTVRIWPPILREMKRNGLR